MEINEEKERWVMTSRGGTGLKDLSDDALLYVSTKLDPESLILLGCADKQLCQFVKEEQIWFERCKKWEKEVNLVLWRAKVESSKALYRLLNSLSRLVGTWKHQSKSEPRGELLYITWGNLSVEAWKVVPSAGNIPPHLSDIGRPVTFVKFFEVVGLRDGSHMVELDSPMDESVDLVLPFPLPGNSFKLQVYHMSDKVLTRDEAGDGGPRGHSFGKKLWSVARQYFGFSFCPVEGRRYTQSRVYNRLTFDEPQPGQELAGLWHGFYGAHGCEVVTVSYTEEGLILGTKVLGDVNVPAGVVTFKAYISTESARRLYGKFYTGKGRIADETYMNPQWVDGVLVTLAGGAFLFHWRPLFSSITFHRLELEALFRSQRESEANRCTSKADS
ncbi:hypothetical protein R1flu_018319 [Riccia fluitans]|uniref:F-box protein n=1 Tax=Riccia fluitans TaxID=41844 RepID=A0ABD1ZFH1_9MARC